MSIWLEIKSKSNSRIIWRDWDQKNGPETRLVSGSWILIAASKGQEISKGKYGVFNSSKNEPLNSVLASKKKLNQKIKAHYYTNYLGAI